MRNKKAEGLILIGIFLIELLAAIDITGVTVLTPKLKGVFGISDSYAGLFLLAYLVPFSIFMIPIGWFADKKFGIEKVMLCSIFGFFVFSLVCAFSANLIIFVTARFIKGVCAAGIFTTEFAIIIKYWKKPRRIVEIAIAGLALGVLLGPLAGAFFVDHWRAFFLVGAILALFSFVALLQIKEIVPIKREVDNSAPLEEGFVPKLKILFYFLFWGMMLNFVMAASSQGINLIITIHLQETLGRSAFFNGIVLSIIAFSMLCVNLSGLSSKLFKNVQIAAWGGSALFSIATISLFFTGWTGPFAWLSYVLIGIFYGIVLSTVELMSLMPLKTENLAVGNGIIITAMQVGFAVGTLSLLLYAYVGTYSLFIIAMLPISVLFIFIATKFIRVIKNKPLH